MKDLIKHLAVIEAREKREANDREDRNENEKKRLKKKTERLSSGDLRLKEHGNHMLTKEQVYQILEILDMIDGEELYMTQEEIVQHLNLKVSRQTISQIKRGMIYADYVVDYRRRKNT